MIELNHRDILKLLYDIPEIYDGCTNATTNNVENYLGINESFTKCDDKLENLGIGKKALIIKWLDDNKISKYKLLDNLSINVFADVIIRTHGPFPDYIQFNYIDGNFYAWNLEIGSFRGFPQKIEGSLYAGKNTIYDIGDAPKFVGGIIDISDNPIPHSIIVDYVLKNNDKKRANFASMDESFTKGDDKLSNLGVGKKVLIKDWLEKYNINNYIIDKDFTITVKGDVNLMNKDIEELPDFINFKTVVGKFDISQNNLSSLRGCPTHVAGSFLCDGSKNTFMTLDDAPTFIGNSIHINRYSNFFRHEFVPVVEIEKYLKRAHVYGRIYSDFSKYNNVIVTSIFSKIKKVDESFERGGDKLNNLGIGKAKLIHDWLKKNNIDIYKINDDFTIDTFEVVNLRRTGDFPDYIQFNIAYKNFFCTDCDLTTLRGCPFEVLGMFGCGYNHSLKSFEYVPKHISGNFVCKDFENYENKLDISTLNNLSNIEGRIITTIH
jgi:hypothetical protein